MIRLNLLPDIKREYIKSRRAEAKAISFAILASFVSVAAMVLLGFYTYGVQGLQQMLLTNEIKSNEKKLESTKDINKYVTLQNQLNAITSLHENKNTFSTLFAILPKLNPPAPNTVSFTSITLDTGAKTVVFEGKTGSFASLITFRDTLVHAKATYSTSSLEKTDTTKATTPPEQKTAELFSNVNIDDQNLSQNDSGQPMVTFKITSTYLEDVFKATASVTDVTVPKLDTTPSRQGTPSQTDATQTNTTPTQGGAR